MTMEWKSHLRRTQSAKSIPLSCDKPTWKDAGLRDKTASVSQLVSRYQTGVKVNKPIPAPSRDDAAGKPKQVLNETKPSPRESTDTPLESLMHRKEEKDMSRAKTNLSRSKSEGSLQNSTGSIEALKALFESKGTAQNRVKSNVRAASLASTFPANMPVMKGEAEDVKRAAEKQRTPTAKEDQLTQKVVNQTSVERRKTIGGIDFEKIAASQAEDKRKSIAGLRENSFIQTKESLAVSVKAISALYMSKVANQDSKRSVHKQGPNQTRESGKRVNLSKMAEDSQQRKDDLPQLPSERLQPGLKDLLGAHTEQSTPSQISKEMLYQQRQKCELRRLLKHTHPELKMLDDVVDEEFAEVLSSENVTAAESGYEGEVLSRCLIFENCGVGNDVPPFNPKIQMAKGVVERRDISKTSAVFQTSNAEPDTEIVKGVSEDDKGVDTTLLPDRECEDEIRIDVQATRRIFENVPDQKTFQGIVSKSGDETKVVKAQDKECEMSYREKQNKRGSFHLEELPRMPCIKAAGQSTERNTAGCEKASCCQMLFEGGSEGFSDSEKHSDMIKTSAALFKNNPFISANIEKEHTYEYTSKPSSEVREDYLPANVKNRAHLFESMPFDKIRHQNKDEIETLVENIKETLNFLHRVEVIYSSGTIIEVNETMIARKAKFTLCESGPEIRYDEVAEGGAQNFILQLLPRANLKPQITYLKEDSKESMKATVLDVPVQQHHFNTNKDSEFKTANVAQLVEDILNQDNSLRKGVIIQEDISNCADVIVYSLYKYFNEKDVKSYSPPEDMKYSKAEPEDVCMRDKIRPPETSEGQTYQDIRPDIKGNVKLFKNCIEKGDLEFLKTLHTEPAVQEPELPQNQMEAGQNKERPHEQKGDANGEVWVPVDVKRLKNMFSGDRSHIQESYIKSAKIPHTSHKTSQSSTECNTDALSLQQEKRECEGQAENFQDVSYFEAEDDKKTHLAELREVVDKTNEISDLQTAVHKLRKTTTVAKSVCLSTQEMQKPLPQGSSNIVSSTNAALLQESLDQNVESEFKWNKSSSASETCHENSNSETMQTADTWSNSSQDRTEFVHEQHIQTSTVSAQSSDTTPSHEEDEDVVLQGSVQAALKSLERSNINITKGDFKAAMIYRNSSNKSHQESPQNVADTEESCQMTKSESTQGSLRQEVASENMGAASKKSKTHRGPKPAIPTKPKHLMVKQEDTENNQQGQSTLPSIENVNAAQMKTMTTKETTQVPQPSPDTSDSYKHDCKQQVSASHQRNPPLDEETQMLKETESCQKDRNTISGQEIATAQEEETPHNAQGKDNVSETDESPVDFHKACQKFGGKKANKTAPVKPKRVKIAQTKDNIPLRSPEDNTRPVFANVDPKPEQNLVDPSSTICERTVNKGKKNATNIKPEVEMRERKVCAETEDERRLRLSVHMDEIVRGNITATMEIVDNLRKREQLQSILNRVEEIQQETSEVDVKSLRKVFEDASDWVVVSEKQKPKKNKARNKEKSKPLPKDRTGNSSSMAHVYGDLERASEEIMNLKEQTLARLMDIEEAIKKALYSVSTLKSDSDIAGLSYLFKESLGLVQGSSPNGNINKASNGSLQRNTTTLAAEGAGTEVPRAKQQPSPPLSPAFISIQSAARKTDKAEAVPAEASICPAKPGARFRSAKTLTCSSSAQKGNTESRNSNRELSVLEVQTDSEGNSMAGTKTITENSERADNTGKRFYSSKTSTVVEAQPAAMATASQAISRLMQSIR